jgi:hypothetical protein
MPASRMPGLPRQSDASLSSKGPGPLIRGTDTLAWEPVRKVGKPASSTSSCGANRILPKKEGLARGSLRQGRPKPTPDWTTRQRTPRKTGPRAASRVCGRRRQRQPEVSHPPNGGISSEESKPTPAEADRGSSSGGFEHLSSMQSEALLSARGHTGNQRCTGTEKATRTQPTSWRRLGPTASPPTPSKEGMRRFWRETCDSARPSPPPASQCCAGHPRAMPRAPEKERAMDLGVENRT